jgi:hypothetical protein
MDYHLHCEQQNFAKIYPGKTMGIKSKLVVRGSIIIGFQMILMSTLACAGLLALPPDIAPHGSVDIDDDIIKMVDENGGWVPIAGKSTFELIGELEDRTPWTVTGQATEINELTQITDSLQVGDNVRVRGAILEDGAWLAYSIEPAAEQTKPAIILIGRITSLAPWVVDQVELQITSETEFKGDIRRGMLMRVEHLLLPDGTWGVMNIAPLGDFTEAEDCVTAIAKVGRVNRPEVQFLGWPLIGLHEDVVVEVITGGEDNNDIKQDEDETVDDDQDKDGDENETDNDHDQDDHGKLRPNQDVLLLLCPSGDDQISIEQIIILNALPDEKESSAEREKVSVCHWPDKDGGRTLSISSSAVAAHLAHGDKPGDCD